MEFFDGKGGFYANSFDGPALADLLVAVMRPKIDVPCSSVTTGVIANDGGLALLRHPHKIIGMQREAKRKAVVDQRPFRLILERHDSPIRQPLHLVVHIHRHQVELAGLGEHIHAQHGVVFGDAAAHGDAGKFVNDQGDGAHDGAGGVACFIGFA